MKRGFISFTLVLLVSACANLNDVTSPSLAATATVDSRNADLNLTALSSSQIMEKIKAEALTMSAEEIRSMPYGNTIVNADGSIKNLPEIKGLRRATNLVGIKGTPAYPDLVEKLSDQRDFSGWYVASLVVPNVGAIGTIWFPEKELQVTSLRKPASEVILYVPTPVLRTYEKQPWLPERAVTSGITTKPPSLSWTLDADGNRRLVWTFSKNNQTVMYDPYESAEYVVQDATSFAAQSSLTAQAVSSDLPEGLEYTYGGKEVILRRVR